MGLFFFFAYVHLAEFTFLPLPLVAEFLSSFFSPSSEAKQTKKRCSTSFPFLTSAVPEHCMAYDHLLVTHV